MKSIFGNFYTREYLPGIYCRTGYTTGSGSGMFWKCLTSRVGAQKKLNLTEADLGLIK